SAPPTYRVKLPPQSAPKVAYRSGLPGGSLVTSRQGTLWSRVAPCSWGRSARDIYRFDPAWRRQDLAAWLHSWPLADKSGDCPPGVKRGRPTVSEMKGGVE